MVRVLNDQELGFSRSCNQPAAELGPEVQATEDTFCPLLNSSRRGYRVSLWGVLGSRCLATVPMPLLLQCTISVRENVSPQDPVLPWSRGRPRGLAPRQAWP